MLPNFKYYQISFEDPRRGKDEKSFKSFEKVSVSEKHFKGSDTGTKIGPWFWSYITDDPTLIEILLRIPTS